MKGKEQAEESSWSSLPYSQGARQSLWNRPFCTTRNLTGRNHRDSQKRQNLYTPEDGEMQSIFVQSQGHVPRISPKFSTKCNLYHRNQWKV